MAEKKSRVVVEILGDAKRLGASTKEADGFLGKLGGSVAKAGAALAAFGAAATAAGAVVGFNLANAASDLQESISKTNVIFGDGAKSVLDWSKTTSTALGISQVQALDAASTFATFGKAAGITGEDLSSFASEFVGLSADLASFNNATPEETIEAIGAALRGEAEPMRRFGVLLDDATLRAKALELGIISSTKNALTPQQKVLAAQAVIWAQTADAQGDFARTSEGFANQQRILSAQLDNVKVSIGTMLLPAFSRMAWTLNTSVIPAVTTLVETFGAKGLRAAVAQFGGMFDGTSFEGMAKVLSASLGWIIENWRAVAIGLGAIAVAMAAIKVASFVQSLAGLALMLGPVGLKIAAVAAAFALLVAGFVFVYNRSSALRRILQPLVGIFREVRESVMRVAAAFREGGLGGALRQLGAEVLRLAPIVRDGMVEFGRRIWDALTEVGGRIGGWVVNDLMPAMGRAGVALWEWIEDAVPPALKQLGEWIGAFGDWVTGKALPAVGRFGERAGKAIWEWIADAVPATVRQLGSWLSSFGSWVTNSALPGIARFASGALVSMTQWLKDATDQAPEALGRFAGKIVAGIVGLNLWLITEGVPKLTAFVGRMAGWLITEGVPMVVRAGADMAWALLKFVGDAIIGLPGRLAAFTAAAAGWVTGDGARSLANLGRAMGNAITAPIRFSAEAIKEFWNSTIAGKGGFTLPTVRTPFGSFGGQTFGGVPRLAEGGIVTRPTLALIGEGGESEAVIPLSKLGNMGGGGRTINLTVHAGMGTDGRAVGRQIIAAIRDAERTDGASWRTGSRLVPGLA